MVKAKTTRTLLCIFQDIPHQDRDDLDSLALRCGLSTQRILKICEQPHRTPLRELKILAEQNGPSTDQQFAEFLTNFLIEKNFRSPY